MKPENTLEEKAKFFAQYWGQDVLVDVTWLNVKTIYPILVSNLYRIEESHLELTPISQISDEDAIGVTRVLYPDIKSFHKAARGKEFVRVFTATNHREYLYDPIRTVKGYKFLISKGYYVGDGTEVSYGWVKLREEQSCK